MKSIYVFLLAILITSVAAQSMDEKPDFWLSNQGDFVFEEDDNETISFRDLLLWSSSIKTTGVLPSDVVNYIMLLYYYISEHNLIGKEQILKHLKVDFLQFHCINNDQQKALLHTALLMEKSVKENKQFILMIQGLDHRSTQRMYNAIKTLPKEFKENIEKLTDYAFVREENFPLVGANLDTSTFDMSISSFFTSLVRFLPAENDQNLSIGPLMFDRLVSLWGMTSCVFLFLVYPPAPGQPWDFPDFKKSLKHGFYSAAVLAVFVYRDSLFNASKFKPKPFN